MKKATALLKLILLILTIIVCGFKIVDRIQAGAKKPPVERPKEQRQKLSKPKRTKIKKGPRC